MNQRDFLEFEVKIINEKERERLRNIVKNNNVDGYGAIIRTSAEGKNEEELVQDLKNTIQKYKSVKRTYSDAIAGKILKPQLLFKSEDIIQRILTDFPYYFNSAPSLNAFPTFSPSFR